MEKKDNVKTPPSQINNQKWNEDSSEIEQTSIKTSEKNLEASPLQQKKTIKSNEKYKQESIPSKTEKTSVNSTIDAVSKKPRLDSPCETETSNFQPPAGTADKLATPSNQKKSRKFERIPIFIVDYHNDVMQFLYRAMGTGFLPLENNLLIHFDSHPDMVISREISAKASYDFSKMLSELSIENWIMPMCFAGHFNRIAWLKNSWCTQIPTGTYDFKVGEKEDRIRVDCPLSYFLSEGSFCPTHEMENTRDITLSVHDADVADGVHPSQFVGSGVPNIVLDIDLDFFSTTNPFIEIYKEANCYAQLTEIFFFDAPSPEMSDCVRTTEVRMQQLEELKRIFEHLENTRNLDEVEPNLKMISTDVFEKIRRLVEDLKRNYADEEIDYLLIYDSGSTTDTEGLPHHVSTDAQLSQYYKNFKEFLERLPSPPVVITIACSAEDDYCPRDQVAYIECEVLRILKEVFGDRLVSSPILQYMGDDWDIYKL